MYYNTILQLIAALTNVTGTTYAILSILKLKPKDLYQAITIDGMDKNDESLLTQKKQARIGICLVIYAWVLQVIFSFFSISSGIIFALSLLTYVVVTVALCFSLFLTNKRFEKKYFELREQMDKENNDRHSDYHSITEF
mgnify:CR=1 FL=1